MALDWEFLAGCKERAAKAIEEGNKEEALKYLEEVNEQFHRMHDFLINWVSACYGKLAEAYSEDWLVNFNREFFFEQYDSRFEPFKDMTPEKRLKAMLDGFRLNYHEFEVDEDDEKYIVKITGCCNGGRLLKEGLAKRQNAVTKEAKPWSFNRVGFPYYCIHANDFMAIWAKYGIKMKIAWGQQYDDEGNKIDDPCIYYIYK
jgi:hypothetical protein